MNHDRENHRLIFEPIDQFYLSGVTVEPEDRVLMFYEEVSGIYRRHESLRDRLIRDPNMNIALGALVAQETALLQIGYLKQQLRDVAEELYPDVELD